MQTAAGGAAFNASLSTSRELKVKATLLFCRMNLAGDSFLLEGTGGCGTQSLKGLQAAYSYREHCSTLLGVVRHCASCLQVAKTPPGF